MASRSPPWVALASSGLLHLALGSMLVFASTTTGRPTDGGAATTAGARAGVIQLRGTGGERAVGQDAMLDILSAADGFPVRLTSAEGLDAVGIAWVSPSLGMWLALDKMAVDAGETVHAWRGIADEPRTPLASVSLDETGSGRVVVRWDGLLVTRPRERVTLQVTGRRGFWPFGREPVVLQGTGVSRELDTLGR